MKKAAGCRAVPWAALSVTVALAVVLAGCGNGGPSATSATTTTLRPSPTTSTPPASTPTPPVSSTTVPAATPTFRYGFDLSTQAPDSVAAAQKGQSLVQAPGTVTAARRVLARFAGSLVDQSMYGFGANSDPEPSPGVFNMTAIARRLSWIERAGGKPVITLYSAPAWMRDPGSPAGFNRPPTPDHYQDFATLCAHVAAAFPQVKYFVVWNELKGFWDPAARNWNYQAYTTMYNDVYRAIKKVRPNALVGGPYAVMSAQSLPVRRVPSTVNGPFGYLDQGMLEAVTYWLAHSVGADFIAVDGATANAKSGQQLMDAVTAAQQYAAVDGWIRSQTTLPIWWMESHIAPSGWTAAQGAAARVATLAVMSASGATVGMQWQPQEQVGWSDEGLWTSTLVPGGGQATPLAAALLRALPVLERRPVLATVEPTGVLVGSDTAGTLAVNTTAQPVVARVGGRGITLAPGEVLVS